MKNRNCIVIIIASLESDTDHEPENFWQEGEDREVENRLVMKLDFNKFDVIKELLQNRSKIVWCMRLERAGDDEERGRLEVCLGLRV